MTRESGIAAGRALLVLLRLTTKDEAATTAPSIAIELLLHPSAATCMLSVAITWGRVIDYCGPVFKWTTISCYTITNIIVVVLLLIIIIIICTDILSVWISDPPPTVCTVLTLFALYSSFCSPPSSWSAGPPLLYMRSVISTTK
jgi:hypothetical protein